MKNWFHPRLRLGVCIPLVLGIEADALGQTNPDPAKIYDDAVPLMREGDYENACRMLQKSYDIEPKFGRLYTLALCRDLQGRTATALGLYKEYLTGTADLEQAELMKHKERRAKAAERVQALNESVPKLKLIWRGEAPRDIDVQVDGRDALPQLNTDWPQDPGDHVITVRKKDGPDQSQTVTLANDQPVNEVDLTPVEVAPVKVDVPAPVPDVHITSERFPDKLLKPAVETPASPSFQRNLGRMWFGVAAAGGVGAGVLGIIAATKKGDVEEGCPRVATQLVCKKAGAAALEEGTMWADAATTSLVLSGALAVVGLVELTRSIPKKTAAERHLQLNVGAGQQHGFVTFSGRF